MQIGAANSYSHARVAGPAQAAAPTRSGATDSLGERFAAALAGATDMAPRAIADENRYAPNSNSVLSYLTPDDRKMLSAATGYVVSSDGVVQNPNRRTVDPFIMIMASDRMSGRLEGSVTDGYLKDVFAKYATSPRDPNAVAIDPAYLDRALDFLATQDKQRAEGIARSSFSLGV